MLADVSATAVSIVDSYNSLAIQFNALLTLLDTRGILVNLSNYVAPTNVIMTGITDAGFDIAWNSAITPTSFNIYINNILVATIPGSQTSYAYIISDNSQPNAVLYTYSISATDGVNETYKAHGPPFTLATISDSATQADNYYGNTYSYYFRLISIGVNYLQCNTDIACDTPGGTYVEIAGSNASMSRTITADACSSNITDGLEIDNSSGTYRFTFDGVLPTGTWILTNI